MKKRVLVLGVTGQDGSLISELLCKKNPLASKAIFYKFFLDICVKANSSS